MGKLLVIRNADFSAVAIGKVTPSEVSAPIITISANYIVSISADFGATIRYTIDNSQPTTTSTLYTAPFQVSFGVTIKAIAIKDGKISPVSTESSGLSVLIDNTADATLKALTVGVYDRWGVPIPQSIRNMPIGGIRVAIDSNSEGAVVYPIKTIKGSTTFEDIGDSYVVSSDDVTKGYIDVAFNQPIVVDPDSNDTLLGLRCESKSSTGKYPASIQSVQSGSETRQFFRCNDGLYSAGMTFTSHFNSAIAFLG